MAMITGRRWSSEAVGVGDMAGVGDIEALVAFMEELEEAASMAVEVSMVAALAAGTEVGTEVDIGKPQSF